jgi:hypothetical protein
MRIPTGPPLTVNIAQFFGLILTVILLAGHGDIFIGMTQLLEGFDEGLTLHFPNATKPRW